MASQSFTIPVELSVHNSTTDEDNRLNPQASDFDHAKPILLPVAFDDSTGPRECRDSDMPQM
ncbi:hypothetical protein VKT23_005074 [Stygiomarasmius scandens]|uniref:Uncharacterized protein n=1 Tax=Marasmiellus scandens TaxID=2682957 RepID=A0ABR1JSW9_9AGAR